MGPLAAYVPSRLRQLLPVLPEKCPSPRVQGRRHGCHRKELGTEGLRRIEWLPNHGASDRATGLRDVHTAGRWGLSGRFAIDGLTDDHP